MRENISSTKKTGINVIMIATLIVTVLNIIFTLCEIRYKEYSTPDKILRTGKILTKQKTIKLRNESSIDSSLDLSSEVKSIFCSVNSLSAQTQNLLDLKDAVAKYCNVLPSTKTTKITIPAGAIYEEFGDSKNYIASYIWKENTYDIHGKCLVTSLVGIIRYNNTIIKAQLEITSYSFNTVITTAYI